MAKLIPALPPGSALSSHEEDHRIENCVLPKTLLGLQPGLLTLAAMLKLMPAVSAVATIWNCT
jgi:hypothetical protein